MRASEALSARIERARAASPLNTLMSALQDQRHRRGEALPLVDLFTERSAALPRDGVVARASVVLGVLPVALDVAAMFEPLERGIERALVDLQPAARDLLDAEPNSPAVHRFQGERFQDQQVDAA